MKRAWIVAVLGLVAFTGCGNEQQSASPADAPAPTQPTTEETGLPDDCVDMSGEEAVLVAFQREWEPLCIALAPGQDLTVENRDFFGHTFTIDSAGIDEEILDESEVVIEGVGDATVPGEEIEFMCRFHSDMIGYLNVV